MSAPSRSLKAKITDEGHIVVEPHNTFVDRLILIGCSEVTNVPPGSHTPCLVIFPQLEEGQEGLVVLRSDDPNSTAISWPLRISLKEDNPWLSINEAQEGYWSCKADRIGGSVMSHLEVNLDGKWYRSDEPYGGKGCIPDPDLICRFLVGKADKEELLRVIQEADEEKSAKEELGIARHRIRELERQLEQLKGERRPL